jgi:hypothetical protein
MKKIILGLGLVLLFSALGLVMEAQATLGDYDLAFFGAQTGSGHFSFDAGSATNTTIGAPATLVNLSATLQPSGFFFAGSSPGDDFVFVDGAGIVTKVHADLVATNGTGIKLQLYEDLTYSLTVGMFKPAYGTYTVTDPAPCPVPAPGTVTLVGTGLIGLWGWRRRRG